MIHRVTDRYAKIFSKLHPETRYNVIDVMNHLREIHFGIKELGGHLFNDVIQIILENRFLLQVVFEKDHVTFDLSDVKSMDVSDKQ